MIRKGRYFHGFGCAIIVSILLLGATAFGQTPREKVESLELETLTGDKVSVFFAPPDKARAGDLAELADDIANHLADELAIDFQFDIAALGPDKWFSQNPNIPYAIPWPSMKDKLIFMPSSLQTGILIQGESQVADRRRLDFILLHEYGHLASKYFFRASSEQDYLPVAWLEELLATYFAYAYLSAAHPEWADAAKREWTSEINAYTPHTTSLDWSYMRDLPGQMLAREYGWYQFNLNLWAAELFDEHGIDLLRTIKVRMNWNESDSWTSESVVPDLVKMSPEFGDWIERLGGI